MKLELPISEDFGHHLADGSLAAEYRIRRIEPYLNLCPEIVIDFTHVRTANSSFVNALITPLIEHHGEPLLKQLVFKGCAPLVRVLVEGAIDLGLEKRARRVDA
jgi:STAS-like domain of unknown function (DUF4325)